MALSRAASIFFVLTQTAFVVGEETCSSEGCANRDAEGAAVSLMQTNLHLSSERKTLESAEFAEFKRDYMETQRKKTEFFGKLVQESTLSDEAKSVHDDFRDFLGTNFRSYDSLPESPDVDVLEYLKRLATFAQNMKKIDARNAHEARTNTHPNRAVHGVTKYADWSEGEFRALLGHRSKKQMADKGHPTAHELSTAPNASWTTGQASLLQASAKCTKNWASRTQMRNQGTCGSCWTFSTATTLRAAFIQQHGQDPGKLSTQFIVDCMNRETCSGGVNGCCGGDVAAAMEWITAQGGIPTQEAYGDYYTTTLLQADANTSRAQGGPVSPGQGITFSGNHPTTSFPCKTGIPKKVTLTKKPVQLTTESDMADYLCNTGAFAVAVDASQWQTYKSGVMMASSCGTSLDHAVTAIGMDQAQNAWIIQNQWGADWGVSLDGKAPPKDQYSNCPALAKNPGCNDSYNSWIKGACALSCSKSVADGGYIYMQYGQNTCGVAGEAIAATSTKNVGGSAATPPAPHPPAAGPSPPPPATPAPAPAPAKPTPAPASTGICVTGSGARGCTMASANCGGSVSFSFKCGPYSTYSISMPDSYTWDLSSACLGPDTCSHIQIQ